ncbi:hypothetical protein VU08_08900, partial [Desulfobulbus sp. F5]|nr:hypothetical protein [Desulfobulbus sp. F5]
MNASVKRTAASVNRKEKECGLIEDGTSEERIFTPVRRLPPHWCRDADITGVQRGSSLVCSVAPHW